MNVVRQILVDLDGPLLNGKERHYYCYQSILRRHGYEPIGIDEYWRLKRAGANRRVLLNRSGADGIYSLYMREWLELIESPAALSLDLIQDGATECLVNWRVSGMRIALVTMRRHENAVIEQLNRLGLISLLDEVIVCGRGDKKSDAVARADSIEATWGETLWIGDTEVDYEAALALGCEIVLVENGLRSRSYLRNLAGARLVPSISAIEFV